MKSRFNLIRLSRDSRILLGWVGASAILFLSNSCGKSVNINSLGNIGTSSNPSDDPLSNQGSPSAPQSPTQLDGCSESDRIHWQFVQPSSERRGVLDILFVVDTSSSMNNKRLRLAKGVPALLGNVTPGVDYRVAVMLGHGGSSNNSGTLYAPRGSKKVLSSNALSTLQIQDQLDLILNNVAFDPEDSNGEALTYSLIHSLDSSRLATIQGQGFYRENADLSIIFLSDENDICFPPELNGYSLFPDFNPSVGGIERLAYQKYCVMPDGKTPKITPDSIFSTLKNFKKNQMLNLNAIVHRDVNRVPNENEESIGHGFIELVNHDINGKVLDISETDYSNGLGQLGRTLFESLKLLTEFHLDGESGIQSHSILTKVDGKEVKSAFDSSRRSVSLHIEDAGQSLSVIDVSACRIHN